MKKDVVIIQITVGGLFYIILGKIQIRIYIF